MEISDMKKGTTFLGSYIDAKTGSKNIFEAIIVNTYTSHAMCSNNQMQIEAITVIVKSSNPYVLGKMEVSSFSDEQLAEFPIASTHFVGMENIYDVFHTYNPSDSFKKVSFNQMSEDNYSMPIFSVMNDEEPSHAFAVFETHDGKYIQMIILQETTLLPEYKNPYVWINIVSDMEELILQDDSLEFFDDSFLENVEDITVENIHGNNKIWNLFNGAFAPTINELSHFNGLGIVKDNHFRAIIYNLETEEEIINWGTGIELDDSAEWG